MRLLMRRFAVLAAALVCAMGIASAEEAARMGTSPLPAGVTALVEQGYPDYAVACYDGWGDELRGQFALVLSDGEDNVLVVAEREAGDAAYAFTVENPHVVHEWAIFPSVLIDTGGDALFYTYHVVGGRYDTYASFKKDGVWGPVSANLTTDGQGYGEAHTRSYAAAVGDGALRYTRYLEDENGNVLETLEYPPVPVDEAFEKSMRLESFDIDSICLFAEDKLYAVPGVCAGLVDEGDVLLEADLNKTGIIMLIQKPDGTRRIRVAEWDGESGQYTWRDTGALPDQTTMDEHHTYEGAIQITYMQDGDWHMAGFERLGSDKWSLSWVFAQEDFYLGIDWISDVVHGFSGNAGEIFGEHPWGDIFTLDFSKMPQTFEEVLERTDTSGYALVNNPNPEDRLHLRVKPDRNAASLGKFYNRTPVQVLAQEGEWTHVRIGHGKASLEGYMMTQYLAFGGDAQGIESRFPVKDLLAQDGVPMLSAPRDDAPVFADGLYTNWYGDYIIGVVGDEWYVVMRWDGSVGYVRQACFWDGNG